MRAGGPCAARDRARRRLRAHRPPASRRGVPASRLAGVDALDIRICGGRARRERSWSTDRVGAAPLSQGWMHVLLPRPDPLRGGGRLARREGGPAMIAGHFAFAAAVRSREKSAPMWALMLASQWLDVVF